MLWPLTETLEILAPGVPSNVVPLPALLQSQQLAAILPHATSSCYWECRLAADAAQVDFLTCIATCDNGRTMLTEHGPDKDYSQAFNGEPVWDHAHRFFTQWADPSSPLYEGVPLIWLEFDHVESVLPCLPLPSFSFCVDPLYAERRSWEHYIKARTLSYRHHLAEEGLPLLLGQSLSSPRRHVLRTCFEALPVEGRLIHLSAMVARQPAVVKLYCAVPRIHLFSYLDQIGWRGAVTELTDILRTFCTAETVDDTMYIDLSLDEMVLPRLGVAFAQQQIPHLPGKDPTRRALLDRCVQAGLCSTEKRDALLRWPGRFRIPFAGEQWPTTIHTWLDIKLVSHPHAPLEAKGYLGFMPHFSLC